MNHYKKLLDEEVVELIKQGENVDDLYQILIERYDKYIEQFIKRIIYSRNLKFKWRLKEDLEDLKADIWKKVIINLNRFDRTRGNFKTWLNTIIFNSTVDWIEKESRYEPSEMVDEEGNPLFPRLSYQDQTGYCRIVIEEIISLVLKTIQDIPDELQRSILICKFIFWLQEEEIGKIFNLKVSTVKSYLFYALKNFNETFSKTSLDYGNINIEYITDFIKEGQVRITKEQIEQIRHEEAKNVLKLRVFKYIKIQEIAKKLNKHIEEICNLIKIAINELLAAGLKRKLPKVKRQKYPAKIPSKIINLCCDYVNYLIFSPYKKIKLITTRTERNLIIRDIKHAAELIYYTINFLFPKKKTVKSIGEIVLQQIKNLNIDYDTAAKKLKLTIHQLSALMNNKIEDTLKSDKKFIKRLSDFLNMPKKDIVTLLNISFLLNQPTIIKSA